MKICRTLVAGLICVSTWGFVSAVQAQDATATGNAPASSKKEIRKHNLQLERAVRKELDKQKINTSNIRVVARGGAVGLEGTVTDESQIAEAGAAAQNVAGVKSLKNNLSVRLEGH
jgi:hyperosmotically inducible periplasmic protein